VKLRIVLVAALGLCLAAYLVLHIGFTAVLSAAGAVGWGGFGLLCLYALALFPLLGASWALLLPGARGGIWVFVWARMVREAAADVLPFSQVGGIVLGARTAIRHGIAGPEAFASTIVDVTSEALAQIAFVALGFAILSAGTPPSSSSAALSKAFAVGLVLAVLAGVVLVFLQRYGHRVTGRLAARLVPRAAASAEAVADTLDVIYRSRPRIALSSAMHLLGWLASGAGTWIAFRLIGVRVGLPSVIAIESLVGAAKSAAALVPNALGVQEASYAALAPLFGIGPEFGLAVSLLRRARDIAIGAPVLLISQAEAGRRALGGA
jgi:putative membrane protein